jgi:hypothetical protein
MQGSPPPKQPARFIRSGLCRRVHETVVRRRDQEQRIRPIREQDDCSEQPTPLEGCEKGNEPEEPTDDREARLHPVATLIGQLPLGNEGTIIKPKARWLLGDVDVDRCPRKDGGYRERELSSEHRPFLCSPVMSARPMLSPCST